MNLSCVNSNAAVHIQAVYRGLIGRTKMKRMIHALTQIQRFWRGCQAKISFGFDLMSVIVTQSIVRRFVIRRQIERRHRASTDLQKVWRGYNAKVSYGFDLMAVVIVQSVARAFIARRSVDQLRKASVSIQRVWRGHQAKVLYGFVLMDVVVTQSFARRFITRRRAEERICASSRIQSVLRGYRKKNEYVTDALDIATAQSIARTFICRKQGDSLCDAAIVIQRVWRGRTSRHKHEAFRLGVITVQSHARCFFARRKSSNMAMAKSHNNAAIGIQRVWRGHKAKHLHRSVFVALVTMQSRARMLTAKRDRDIKLQSTRKHHAATIIQRCWISKTFRSKYLQMQQLVRICQAYARRNLAASSFRRQKNCAVVMQRHWRGFCARVQVSISLGAASVIQACIRRDLASTHVSELKERAQSVVKTQSLWKASKTKQLIAMHKAPAVSIQTFARQASATKAAANQHYLAILIQSSWRRFVAKRQFMKSLRDVVVVQGLERCHHQQVAAVAIQSGFRHWLRRRQAQHAINIQRNWKGFSVRQEYRRKLQCHARRCIARRTLSRIKSETSVAEPTPYYDHSLLSDQEVVSFVSRHAPRRHHVCDEVALRESPNTSRQNSPTLLYEESAVIIQKAWRCYTASIALSIIKIAADIIQNTSRRYLVKLKMRRLNDSATTIQRFSRGMCTRMHNREETIAATEIQRVWRGYSVNVEFMLTVLSAIRIQSCARRFLEAKSKVDGSYRREEPGTTASLLTNGSDEMSLYVVDSSFDGQIELQPDGICSPRFHIDHGVQGVQTRKQLRRSSALQSAQKSNTTQLQPLYPEHSAQRITTRSTTMTLNLAQSAEALRVLKTSRRLSEVSAAVSTLESTTMQSVDCCKYFTEANAHYSFFYLIGSCNRSSPHLELLMSILQTLTNVASHPSTVPPLATVEAVDILTDLVQMFRDKSRLFALSSSLLERLILSDNTLLVSELFC
eukprot:scaffold2811_cov188-Alexandrium_tamarense.AAC.6